VDNERDAKRFESVYSKKVRAGKRRTYFFDVRRTRGEDFYLTLTESTKRMQGGYERHKIFLYKEDFNRFVQALEETVEYIKTELMPQYDYDEFARRQDEYEARIAAENEGRTENEVDNEVEGSIQNDIEQDFEKDEELKQLTVAKVEEIVKVEEKVVEVKTERPARLDDDEDMSW
jgi:Protein of unknown function (DUF3276)